MIEKWKKEEKKSSLVGDVVIQTIPLTGRRCSTLANNRKLSKHPVTKNTKKQGKQNTDDKLKFNWLCENSIPASIYLFKVNNRNTRKRCEICSKLTIKTPERRHWRHSGAFTVNFEHISHLFLVFPLLTLKK